MNSQNSRNNAFPIGQVAIELLEARQLCSASAAVRQALLTEVRPALAVVEVARQLPAVLPGTITQTVRPAITKAAADVVVNFQHPGLSLSNADLAELKSKLTVEPWKSAYAALAADSRSQLSYVMQGPFATVSRTPNVNLGQYGNDMQAVYNLARMWSFTGNAAYAQKARDILIAWATTQTSFGGAESYLTVGDYAYRTFGGADILRGTWSGWTQADTDACKTYFANVLGPASPAPLPLRSANQGIDQLITGVGIAIFNDDATLFNQCLQSFLNDKVGGLANSLPNGELGDSGRDQGHAYGQLLHLAIIAEMFWRQGVDVYSALDNRLLAAGEFYARYNLGVNTPFLPFGTKYDIYLTHGGAPNSSPQSPDALSLIFSHYVTRKGMSAPYLSQYLATRPQNLDSFVWYRTKDDDTTATTTGSLATPAPAVPLTTGLINTGIGTSTPAGTGTYSNGKWTLTGGGADIWGNTDSYHYAYKQLTGDFTFIARVDSLQELDANTKAGLVMRDSLAANATRRVFIGIVPGANDPTVQTHLRGYTANSHNDPDEVTHNGLTFPQYLKIERIGTRVTVYHSSSGANWTAGQNAEYAGWTGTAYVGLGVASHVNGSPTTAVFGDVRVTGGDGGEALRAPPTPFAVYASPGHNQVPLRWLESLDATSYVVRRASSIGGPFTPIATVAGNSYVDTTAVNGGTYYYAVRAVNSAGVSGDSPADVVTLPFPPAPPSGMTAAAASASRVVVDWAASAGAVSYTVKRATVSGGPYATIAAGITGTEFLDTGLTASTKYYYVVTAVNAGGGESASSSQISATPSDLLMRLKFDEAGGVVAADATGNGRNGTLVNGPVFTAGSLNNAVDLDGVSQYVGVPGGVVNDLTSVTIATRLYLDSATNWARVFDFGTGTSKYMYLTPKNGSTNVARFAITTNGGSGEQQINSTAALPVGAWAHVAVTITGSVGILYVNGIEVGRNSAMTLNPASLGATTLNYIGKSQFTADPTLNGRVDDFRVYARALTASEIYSLARSGIPAAPATLTATAGNGQVSLAWSAVSGAASYTIKRATVNGGPYVTIAAGLTTTSRIDTGLANGTQYYYVVTATNAIDESASSIQASATPAGAAPAVSQFTVNDGSAQRSRVSSVTVAFDQAVSLAASGVSLLRGGTAAAGITVAVFPTSGLNTQYTITFGGSGFTAGSLIDGRYTLVLSGAAVASSAGVTTVSDPTYGFHRLYGDNDGNAIVDFNDFLALQTAFGSTAGSAAFVPAFDSDDNNGIDFNDFLAFQTRFGVTV